ncbi:MAG: TlyA family RNA methyltransferase [Thermostichales cyanobacterium SRBZ-1_bins_19]
MTKIRLDQWLVEQGYFASRQQAQRAIQAGQVLVNGDPGVKPGAWVDGTVLVQVRSLPSYVSRGGEKLAGALGVFSVQVRGRVCLDGGISTGGFTDCLLQRGAAKVWGVDVGYGQVAWKLQTDPRVVIRERCNLRYLTPTDLYGSPEPEADLATLDLAFISLTLVLPALWHLLRDPKEVLALVKPQFEAGREQVGKKGVVRDPQVHRQVIARVWGAAQSLGWGFRGLTWSPLRGANGNIEYWLWLAQGCEALEGQVISEVVEQAHRCLTA